MTPPDLTDTEMPLALPPEAAIAGSYTTSSLANEHAVVLAAMNLPFEIVADEAAQYHLIVGTDRLPAAERELTAYEEEMRSWKPSLGAPADDTPFDSFYGPYFVTLFLICAFIVQQHYGQNFVDDYRMDAVGVVTRGEWWRLLTALALHADMPHLLGNLTMGVWYGALASRSFGAWRTWGLIVLSGVLGNTLVALDYVPAEHFAIGASTAVFGALGLLVGSGLVETRQLGATGRQQAWLPLIGGAIILALTGGFQTPHVDALAHLYGFLSGAVLGLLVKSPWRASRRSAN